jgi:hypothetical protein
MSRLKSLIYLLSMIASASLYWSCSKPPLAGGTSETTNGFVAVVRTAGGVPVSHALVRLRPEGYLSDTAEVSIQYDSASIIDTITDSSGHLRITGIDTGNYSIEIQDGTGRGALLHGFALKDSIVDCGIAMVTPSGGVRGYIDRRVVDESVMIYVRIYGMERMARADPASGAFVLRDMPEGDHEIYFIASLPSFKPKELHASVSPDSVSDIGKVSLFPFNDWAHSKVVGFNTSASGADISGDVYSFPALVRLNSANFDFSQAKAGGDDLRFTKSDSTPLSYEIERWDPIAGLAEVWVKIDTIFGNNDRQFITMFWGNQHAAPLSKSEAVFDTMGGFQGVWHLGDVAGDSARDATANRYNGVSPDNSSRPQVAEGVIGDCRVFDGAADFITMPNSANGKLNFQETGNYTVSAWVFLDTFDNASHCIVSKGYEQYYLRSTYISKSIPSATPLWEFVEFSETNKWQPSTSPAADKQWALLVGVRQGARQLLYCNGVLADTTVDKWWNDVSRNTGNDLTIGRYAKLVTVPISEGYCYFKGGIDEVRILSAAQSPDWVRLCYMNQRSDDRLVQFKE